MQRVVSRGTRIARRLVGLLLLLWLPCSIGRASVYFVATNGLDSNSGTITSPFATIQRAQDAAKPGDLVYIRGGTYQMKESQIARTQSIWAYVTYLNKSGTAVASIRYWAYPGEHPVFDYSAIKPADLRVTAFFVSGSWLHLKGLEITGVQVTITTHTQSICIENQGSHNTYEQIRMHDGQAIGIYVTRGANNLILNCDAYRNWDYTSENGKGGNVDGFGGHLRAGGTNNVFRGCRAWFNSDDGFDAINSSEAVTFDNCWSFYNGYSTNFASLGDGNGFKAGGHAGTPASQLPDPIPRHVVRFCLAVGNKANGFYANHHIGGIDWYNNTALRNHVNFNLLGRLADNATDVPGYGHVMKNNLGYDGDTEVGNLNQAQSDVSANYFTLGVNVGAKDFASLDESLLTQPRQANGDLPVIALMRLVGGSDLIDQGVDIGFPFDGSAPDLGAFEFGTVDLPVIDSISPLKGGGMRLRFSGLNGQAYQLRATTSPALAPIDLWHLIEVGTFGASATSQDDWQATNYPRRFYRIYVP